VAARDEKLRTLQAHECTSFSGCSSVVSFAFLRSCPISRGENTESDVQEEVNYVFPQLASETLRNDIIREWQERMSDSAQGLLSREETIMLYLYTH
jgi:hypothetical protein